MRNKHDDAKKYRTSEENIPQSPMSPENQGHEKRQTSVSREKQIAAERKSFYKMRSIIDSHSIRKRSDMRQRHKNRSNDHKKCDTFQNKRNALWFENAEDGHKSPHDKWSIYKSIVHVYDRNIVENNVADWIAFLASSIAASIKIGHKTEQNKSNRKNNRKEKFSILNVLTVIQLVHYGTSI